MTAEAPEIRLDPERGARIGIDEAVLCPQKTPAQIERILSEHRAAGRTALLTRLDEAGLAALAPEWRAALDYDPASRTAWLGAPRPRTGRRGWRS